MKLDTHTFCLSAQINESSMVSECGELMNDGSAAAGIGHGPGQIDSPDTTGCLSFKNLAPSLRDYMISIYHEGITRDY